VLFELSLLSAMCYFDTACLSPGRVLNVISRLLLCALCLLDDVVVEILIRRSAERCCCYLQQRLMALEEVKSTKVKLGRRHSSNVLFDVLLLGISKPTQLRSRTSSDQCPDALFVLPDQSIAIISQR
jgi:hypothetical protein